MGYGMSRYMIRLRDFSGLSTRGIRVNVLGPDGLPASLYEDERMRQGLTLPLVADESGAVAFWSALPKVDLNMADPVRGGCVVRGLTPLDHQVTFEPDAAGSKLLGSFVSWSEDRHVVDCKANGVYELMTPLVFDAGQLLVGDVLRVRTRIVTVCSEASAAGVIPLISGDQLSSGTPLWSLGSDAGEHPMQLNFEAVVLRTGETGLLAWAMEAWCHANLSESSYYKQWRYDLTGSSPQIVDLRGAISWSWQCLVWSSTVEQQDVEVVQVTVERVTG